MVIPLLANQDLIPMLLIRFEFYHCHNKNCFRNEMLTGFVLKGNKLYCFLQCEMMSIGRKGDRNM